MQPLDYSLVDLGTGRKLERFGPWLVDRPAPASQGARARPDLWAQADARFERPAGPRDSDNGQWFPAQFTTQTCLVEHQGLHFELRPTDSGQLGLFPEQQPNWQRIAGWLRDGGEASALADSNDGADENRPRVLNLFAYTGGATLAAARAGAAVTHVDAAPGAVAWARQNAAHTGLAQAPIRWICDDAARFARREVRRGRRYEGIVLDPPSFGRGRAGETWNLRRDLGPLLEVLAQLAAPGAWLICTCHTTGYELDELLTTIRQAWRGNRVGKLAGEPLALVAADGRELASGIMALVPPGG